MKILIVEDETLDLFIATKVLESEFDVAGFTTVGECVAWAREHEFDVVLIDYYLGTDVYAPAALAALQAVKPQRISHAFVLSSFIDSSQLKQLKQAGFTDVINKPISLAALRQKLGLG